MALTIRREGMITRKDPHSCMVLCDDGDRSFAYRLNFDSLGPAWEDVKVGNRVSFIRVDSDRTKDDSRAIEVRIIDRTTLDGM